MKMKPEKKEVTASRHPAKIITRPPRKPVEGEDGFGSGHVYEQRKKIYEERDAPLSERKDRE
jgi:hypothetical protein